jgi:hypothetical protein
MKRRILNLLLAVSMTWVPLDLPRPEPLSACQPCRCAYLLGSRLLQGALQVSTSSSSAADLSPLVQTITFKDGQQPAGFKAARRHQP